MKQVFVNSVPLWQFSNLTQAKKIQHFVSGRNSDRPSIEFNLSYTQVDNRDDVTKHRSRLAEAMDLRPANLHFSSQVHLTKVVIVDERTEHKHLLDTDAMITNTPGMGLAVMAADCVPILLYDRENHAIGAVHSGWRGTVARILEKTLAAMRKNFGTQGNQLLAAIGPSISQASYEVGEEVIQATHRAFGPEHRHLLQPQANGKAMLDLWAANSIQLREFGVPEAQIEISGQCTVLENHHFFSARKGDHGRFAAAIVLR